MVGFVTRTREIVQSGADEVMDVWSGKRHVNRLLEDREAAKRWLAEVDEQLLTIAAASGYLAMRASPGLRSDLDIVMNDDLSALNRGRLPNAPQEPNKTPDHI